MVRERIEPEQNWLEFAKPPHYGILKTIGDTIEAYGDAIELFGYFGSQDHDLDLLLIPRRDDWAALRNICGDVKRSLPQLHFFPTHRIQSCICSANPGKSADVHFLLYPSLEAFREQERPFIRYCMSKSVSLKQGSRVSLYPDGSDRPAPDLSYYQVLLHETALIYWQGSFGNRACELREVKYKLLYIVKFALLEAFYREGDLLDFMNVGESVFSLYDSRLSSQAKNLFGAIAGWDKVNDEEVESGLENVFGWLNDLIQGS